MGSPRQGYLGRWVPAVLVATFLVDVAFHFVRLDFLAFRGDEAVSQAVPLGHRYEASRQFRLDRSSGDIASLGNLPEYRSFRPQVFTTDEFGFRNAPEGAHRPPSVLLLGSSFTVGTGNSDEQTLARRLEESSGCPVYNAGGWDRVASRALELTRRLGMEGGLVLLEILERDAWDRPIVPDVRKPRFRYSPMIWWYYTQASHSRLKVVVQRLYKDLCNDRILPNTHKSGVAVRALRDGRPMLFIRSLEHDGPMPALEPHVEAIQRFRDALREGGHRLAVYLIPDKFTVYRDLLEEPITRPDPGTRVLGEFERRLRDLCIPAVNLEPVLRAEARRAFDRGELIYWPDDTHWNPAGIEIAAREISRALDLPASCRRPGEND